MSRSPREAHESPWLPIPQQWQTHSEVHSTLTSFDYVRLSTADPLLQAAAQRFIDRIEKSLGIRWVIVVRGPHDHVGVDVTLEPTVHQEGYRVEIAKRWIRIFGDRPGVFHAFTMLGQLVVRYGRVLPGFEIDDWPSLSIRGMMLAISRTKIPNPERIADLCDEGVALEWGYDKDYPFDQQVSALAHAGKRFITCPSTGTWLSLLGRSHPMMDNTRNAGMAANRYGCLGLLTTEWEDWGHCQPLVVAEMRWKPSRRWRGIAMSA